MKERRSRLRCLLLSVLVSVVTTVHTFPLKDEMLKPFIELTEEERELVRQAKVAVTA